MSERREPDAFLDEPGEVTFTVADVHMATAFISVVAERARQISLGWTPEHDLNHDAGDLSRAAAAYALQPWRRRRDNVAPISRWRPNFWPWAARFWKPRSDRADLVRAAALIIAEIERMDRVAAKAGT